MTITTKTSVTIQTYDETYELPLVSYTIPDPEGKIIVINPKNIEKHSSNHPLEQHPTVYHNLGYVIKQPHDIRLSSSKNPIALKNKKKGQIKIYSRNNLIDEIGLSHLIGYRKDKTQVVEISHPPGVLASHLFSI